MGQEFIIKSKTLEDKVNQLLPSQGGFQAGVDLSASTTVIPIVDLTESAEGSNLRQDLQTAMSLTTVTAFSVANTTTTLINTTGYYRVFGAFSGVSKSGVATNCYFALTDGSTTKILVLFGLEQSATQNNVVESFDFNVFLEAGESLTATSNDNNTFVFGNTRQLADISGNLVNP